MSEYKIVKTVELAGMPNPALAKDLLERLRLATAKVVENRKWRVPVLKEFYPTNRSLLGLNVNRGKSIMIRLREGHDQMSFLPWESVLGTLVHELTHNEIGEHSAEFYKMMEKVYDEVDASSPSAGSLWGPRIPAPKYLFDGKSTKVGGGSLAKTAGIAGTNVRQLAAEAALRRVSQSSSDDNVLGRKVAGATKKTRKELFLEAEERRRAVEVQGGQGCSIVQPTPLNRNHEGSTSTTVKPYAQLLEENSATEWRWVCRVCTEENTSRRSVRRDTGSSTPYSSTFSSSFDNTKQVNHSDDNGADPCCVWCGCAHGSNLLGADGFGGGDMFCIDCDSPVSSGSKKQSVQFVDLINETSASNRGASRPQPGLSGEGRIGSGAVGTCQWTTMPRVRCPCCVSTTSADDVEDSAVGVEGGSGGSAEMKREETAAVPAPAASTSTSKAQAGTKRKQFADTVEVVILD